MFEAGGRKSAPFLRFGKNGVARSLRVVQVQVIHRHGDRTPITPLRDEDYWKGLLPESNLLAELNQRTKIVRVSSGGDEGEKKTKKKQHAAGGGDVFGRLTNDGLQQMMKLGKKLRKEMMEIMKIQEKSPSSLMVLDKNAPESWIRVASTDFSRTIESVQGVLHGLLGFDDDNDDNAEIVVVVNATQTSKMIPDPQPRRYPGQTELERELQSLPAFIAREEKMRPLAVRVTDSLASSGLLGDEAFAVSFGVGEDEPQDDEQPHATQKERSPLPWNQLAEITRCLLVRNMLPKSISKSDQERLEEHNAWRWFELLNHRELTRMAIKSMAKKMVRNAEQAVTFHVASHKEDMPSNQPPPPLLHIFSGHDATLISLMCAFQLERPKVWPDYGSYLKMDLLRNDDLVESGNSDGFFVRFSLNGEPLKSRFGGENDEKTSGRWLIPLEDVTKGMDAFEQGMPLPIH